jgi:uncharacterized protein YigE (DUF2233 family)
MRRFILIILLVVAAFASWFFMRGKPSLIKSPSVASDPLLPDVCREETFEAVDYYVCVVDPKRYEIGLYHLAPDGRPYHDLKNFAAQMMGKANVLFAMNAGMYQEDLSPVGLYVENGTKAHGLETAGASGNFYLKPNGVFFVDKSGAVGVLDTDSFVAAAPDVRLATQSGPMLVINDALHPKFEDNGKSRNIRNGVGIDGEGRAVFAISKSEVSFGSFARLFRYELKCRNALYFDGVVSALSNGKVILVGGNYPAGPIVAVTATTPNLTQ